MNNKKFTLEEAIDCLCSLTITLAYLNSINCFHRDLKQANILVK